MIERLAAATFPDVTDVAMGKPDIRFAPQTVDGLRFNIGIVHLAPFLGRFLTEGVVIGRCRLVSRALTAIIPQ